MAQASLIDELRGARWYGGKSRQIASVAIVDRVRWTPQSELRIVAVGYADGGSERYVLAEQFEEPAIGRALLERFGGAEVATERGGSLHFQATHVLHALDRGPFEPIVPLTGEQSNSSLRFGDALMLKLFRRVQMGPNPEAEIGWFLTEHSSFRGFPEVAGTIDYHAPDGRMAALALLQRFVPNVGDAWRTTLRRLGDGEYGVQPMARLGATTAALHVALAQSGGGAEFDPEPIGEADLAAWREAVRSELCDAVTGLRRHGHDVDADALLVRADGIELLRGACKTRLHGDYHLGQVLESPDGSFVIIDFEGEPAKSLAVRREKRSPLRDVAGMLRSFDYARYGAARASSTADAGALAAWYGAAREAFLAAYLATVREQAPSLLPADVGPPLHALELEKAAYEVLYELNNRPDWLPIPLAALTS